MCVKSDYIIKNFEPHNEIRRNLMKDSRQKENKVDDIIIDNKNQYNETENFLTNENKTLNNCNHVKNIVSLDLSNKTGVFKMS